MKKHLLTILFVMPLCLVLFGQAKKKQAVQPSLQQTQTWIAEKLVENSVVDEGGKRNVYSVTYQNGIMVITKTSLFIDINFLRLYDIKSFSFKRFQNTRNFLTFYSKADKPFLSSYTMSSPNEGGKDITKSEHITEVTVILDISDETKIKLSKALNHLLGFYGYKNNDDLF